MVPHADIATNTISNQLPSKQVNYLITTALSGLLWTEDMLMSTRRDKADSNLYVNRGLHATGEER